MDWTGLIAAAAAAYLIGSFPAGFLAGRARGIDLRKEGSGNVGATNALRVLGRKWGYAVFAVDFAKGVLGVLAAKGIASAMAPGSVTEFGVAGAVCSVLGHNFPVWLGFRGGKGISTSAGAMLALFPLPVFVTAFIVWVGLFAALRYVSLASLGAALSLPLTATALWAIGACPGLLAIVAFVMCALAFWRHRPNIARLLAGTEKRFGGSKKEVLREPGPG